MCSQNKRVGVVHFALHILFLFGGCICVAGVVFGMVEGEDEDDFGDLYWDVLQPFSSSQNGTADGKEETLKCEREEKEVVGSVRLEIYLGSRRVLENSFVFSLGEKKKNVSGDHDSKCEMVGRRDELYSDPPQHVGDSNSEPERDDEAGRIISPDRPVSGSEEGELISDGYNNKAHIQNTRHVETSVPWPRPMRYPYMSSTLLFDLDLESLEYRPWRHTSMDLSHYFNYGLNETSWKIYCHQLKSMRIYAGKQIQGKDEPTATIQSVAPKQNKCYRTFLQGNNQHQDNNNSKRPKLVEDESGREAWSNISDNNERMCRNVGTKDSWFHPIRHHHHHQEEESDRRKSSRKGRSKLERWTRHDRDENTSTSTS